MPKQVLSDQEQTLRDFELFHLDSNGKIVINAYLIVFLSLILSLRPKQGDNPTNRQRDTGNEAE